MQRPSWVEVAVTAVIIVLIVFVLARGKASTAHAPQDQSRKERVVTPARHAAPHAAGERVPPALPQVTDTDEPPAQTQTLKVTHASVRIVFEGDAPRPLTGKAQLSAEDRLGASGWQSLSMPVEHTRSVVFTDVNPCDCSVIVRLSSYMEMRTNFSLAAYVGQQATVVFALEPQWTLRGVIRDRDASDPVQGAHVNLHSTDPYVRTYEAFSDGRGEFDCAELAFPRARVTIAHPWYPTQTVSLVQQPPDADRHAERANGTPAPGIDLVASAAACEFETTTSCDQNGDFAFKSILPDTAYSIRSGSSDGIEVAEPAQPVDLGQPVRVVLKPYSAITFWGSISNTLKAVNTVSYIISHTPVEHPQFDSLYGTDLKLSINAPWSGDCYFYVTAAGCRPKSYHFDLKPDEDVDLGTIWFEKEE